MTNISYLAVLPLALLAFPSAAQTTDDSADSGATITVTATGTPEPLGQTGQSISIITAGALKSLQTPDLTLALARLPGVSFDRSGGIGAATGVFVRGANSEQLLVLIDGVKMEDTAAPSGGYDFGGLLAGGVGRVELLRGSNSVAWGSDAIGGVLAVTGRELNGADASLEVGTHSSWDGEASAGIQRQAGGITLSGGYFTTDGIPTHAGDTAPNGFGQWHLAGHAHLDLAAGLRLVAAGRYAESKLGIDSYDASFNFGHFGDYELKKQGSGRVGLAYARGPLTLAAGVAYADTRRADIDPPSGTLAPNLQFDGGSTRADLTGRIALPADLTVDFGADHEHTRFGEIAFGSGESGAANLDSGHALLGYHHAGLDVTAGARVDRHSRFGTHWTYGANGALALVGGLRAKASYGDGFKAPSLYQLYDPSVGNAMLRPETSHAWDAGLAWQSHNARFTLAATYFNRVTSQLINYVDCYALVTPGCALPPNAIYGFGYYDNIGRARARGVELEATAKPVAGLETSVQYSWIKSIDETPGDGTTGNNLARRPRRLLSASADWVSGSRGVSLGGDLRIVGASFDDAANTVRLPAYALVTLRAAVLVAVGVELYGRVENLGDERYQTAFRYNSARRTATVGVRVKL